MDRGGCLRTDEISQGDSSPAGPLRRPDPGALTAYGGGVLERPTAVPASMAGTGAPVLPPR